MLPVAGVLLPDVAAVLVLVAGAEEKENDELGADPLNSE